MMGILAFTALLAIVYLSYTHKGNKFREIERRQAMRRAVLELIEKNRRLSH